MLGNLFFYFCNILVNKLKINMIEAENNKADHCLRPDAKMTFVSVSVLKGLKLKLGEQLKSYCTMV